MDKNKIENKRIFENYVNVIFAIYFLIFFFRLIEAVLIFHNYSFNKEILFSELFGLGYDIVGASVPIIIYFIFYFFISKKSTLVLRTVNLSLLIITTLGFFVIIKYFLYQLVPLDVFLYKYSFNEVLFTLKTSDTSLIALFFSLILFWGFIILFIWKLHKVKFGSVIIKGTYFFVLVSLLLVILNQCFWQREIDNFSMNKPFHFISKTIKYISTNNAEHQNSSSDEFQQLYPDKNFISREYSLVYEKNRKNELGKYFNDFKSSPNIVILIVEGLNDDFIHEYKGALLMPFVNKLKDRSLYWNRCFTLGERSFAVVPSLLGGLPYGVKGFTLQGRLPRHLSLVSILSSNDYYTSFYYGQGAWFHQKDRFFKYNNIDLIFDNRKFSANFDKIIVGNDNFFWGHNDKDLFNQSLKVIDTLHQNKRLDIYFTGTSHSPFVINNDDYYNEKLKEYTTTPFQNFYSTYSKYLKSVLFVDDALNDFFSEYKKRADYNNTIFIITGDHPMTEIPIANSLKRYHVPLIIFSENLKSNKTFSNFVSHLDISETLLSFLEDYNNNVPSISTSLGSELFSQNTNQVKNLAFMNDNRELVDFLSGDYYLSENKLFTIDSALNIHELVNDSIKYHLFNKLNAFKNTSLLVCENNTVISNDMYCDALNLPSIVDYHNIDTVVTSAEYISLIDKTCVLNNDFIFDISLKVKADENNKTYITYQVVNSKDSSLFWRNFGVNVDGISQAHIRINKMPIVDSIMYFKSYIWNKNKTDLIITDMNVLLHPLKRASHNTNYNQ